MKDDTFELLTKMYIDFTEFRKETSTRFDKVDSRLNKIETTLENDVKVSLQALHERSASNTEKLKEHSEKLESIDNKLDYLTVSVNAQDKRLTVVESSKIKQNQAKKRKQNNYRVGAEMYRGRKGKNRFLA